MVRAFLKHNMPLDTLQVAAGQFINDLDKDPFGIEMFTRIREVNACKMTA